MTDHLEEFREKFQLHSLTAFEGNNWVVSVRPEQVTLGSLILSTSTGALSFEECHQEALQEIGEHFSHIERVCKKDLNCAKLNILCLMMVDPIVHFHIFPRYSSPQNFGGKVWEDMYWPKPTSMQPMSVEEKDLHSLVDLFRKSYV